MINRIMLLSLLLSNLCFSLAFSSKKDQRRELKLSYSDLWGEPNSFASFLGFTKTGATATSESTLYWYKLATITQLLQLSEEISTPFPVVTPGLKFSLWLEPYSIEKATLSPSLYSPKWKGMNIGIRIQNLLSFAYPKFTITEGQFLLEYNWCKEKTYCIQLGIVKRAVLPNKYWIQHQFYLFKFINLGISLSSQSQIIWGMNFQVSMKGFSIQADQKRHNILGKNRSFSIGKIW